MMTGGVRGRQSRLNPSRNYLCHARRGLLGRKRGIFVLVADWIAQENSAMEKQLSSVPPSQEITRSRRIGLLVYPDCDIVDVCGPCDVFHYSD
jgi:hypothetical protein